MRPLRALTLIVVAASMIHAARLAAQQTNENPPRPLQVTDPLAKELLRCKQLNDKAASDERCEAAYKESRRRFLQPPADYHPDPVHMNPGVPEPKLVKPDQSQDK